jgi:hypothetical protein
VVGVVVLAVLAQVDTVLLLEPLVAVRLLKLH